MLANRRTNTVTTSMIMTLTTLIFAVTSMITVYISLSAWKDERESVRPYLTFYNSPEVYFNTSNQLVFSFKLVNVGLHPAASFHSQTLIIESGLTDKPLYNDQFTLVNHIPQNTATDLVIKTDIPTSEINQPDCNPHYIIINLKYLDPIINKKHEQIIYLRWDGIKKGQPQSIFHCSREEKNKIIDYLGKS